MKMARIYEYHGFRINKKTLEWQKLIGLNKFEDMTPKFPIIDKNWDNYKFRLGSEEPIDLIKEKFGSKNIDEFDIYGNLCPYLSIFCKKYGIEEDKCVFIQSINYYFLLKFHKKFMENIGYKEIFDWKETIMEYIKMSEVEVLKTWNESV